MESFRKRFLSHFEYLISTYFLPIKLIMDTLELPYKNINKYSDLGLYWVILGFVVLDVVYWLLQEHSKTLTTSTYKFDQIENTFKIMGICMIATALLSTLNHPLSLALALHLGVGLIFLAKYMTFRRVRQNTL